MKDEQENYFLVFYWSYVHFHFLSARIRDTVMDTEMGYGNGLRKTEDM